VKLALFSDLHANPLAFQACIDHASALQATNMAILGDIVGYGPDPAQTVNMVRELHAQGAWVVRGNHDDLAVSPPANPKRYDESGALWSHQQLDDEQRAFLRDLPLQVLQPPCFLVHASADAPERWRYVNNPVVARDSLNSAAAHAGVHYVLGGHVHLQALYYRGRHGQLMLFEPTPGAAIPVPVHRHWLATVGSVGQPRDGNRAAAYAMLDTVRHELVFYRVPYDVSAVANQMRRKGMDADLIERLERGL
jgi:diadenosine tetraphosphatase ApaH/serine/threonine PP2A family protein phosphatase